MDVPCIASLLVPHVLKIREWWHYFLYHLSNAMEVSEARIGSIYCKSVVLHVFWYIMCEDQRLVALCSLIIAIMLGEFLHQ